MSLSKFQNLKRPIEFINIVNICDESLGQILLYEEDNCSRKRKIMAYALSLRKKQFSVIGRNANVFRPRNAVLKKIFDMDENLFTKHYRLCREDFFALLDTLRPRMERQWKHAISPVDPFDQTLHNFAFFGRGFVSRYFIWL